MFSIVFQLVINYPWLLFSLLGISINSPFINDRPCWCSTSCGQSLFSVISGIWFWSIQWKSVWMLALSLTKEWNWNSLFLSGLFVLPPLFHATKYMPRISDIQMFIVWSKVEKRLWTKSTNRSVFGCLFICILAFVSPKWVNVMCPSIIRLGTVSHLLPVDKSNSRLKQSTK